MKVLLQQFLKTIHGYHIYVLILCFNLKHYHICEDDVSKTANKNSILKKNFVSL